LGISQKAMLFGNQTEIDRNVFSQDYEGKIKGRIEVTRRRGRRRKKLLDDLGDRRGYSFEGGSCRSH
jgi:hypothetical protein